MIKWQTHEVAKIPEGYQVAVADVNGDGRLDILGLSSAKNIVEWYENPTWKAAAHYHRDRRRTSAWRRCFIPDIRRGEWPWPAILPSTTARTAAAFGGPSRTAGPRVAAAPARQDSHFPSAALGEPGRHGPPGSGGRAAAGLWGGGAGI